MKILVIEDSRLLRFGIEKALTKAGHNVTSVGDGAEGLTLAKELLPDLILLDLMLPTMEGTGILRHLKRDSATKLIPVIVLSGLSQKNESKMKAAGASAYFEKSKLKFDESMARLSEILQQLLKESEGKDEHPERLVVPSL